METKRQVKAKVGEKQGNWREKCSWDKKTDYRRI